MALRNTNKDTTKTVVLGTIYEAIQLGQTHQRHAHLLETPLLCNDLVIIHYD